jgi:hypothetical protein
MSPRPTLGVFGQLERHGGEDAEESRGHGGQSSQRTLLSFERYRCDAARHLLARVQRRYLFPQHCGTSNAAAKRGSQAIAK